MTAAALIELDYSKTLRREIRKNPGKHLVKAAHKNTSKIYNKVWDGSTRCKMFSNEREVSRNGETRSVQMKKQVTSSAAHNIACSIATEEFVKKVEDKCNLLRVRNDIKGTNTLSTTMSPGAKHLVEQFMIALTQEALYKAQHVAAACGKKFVEEKAMSLAFDHVLKKVFTEESVFRLSSRSIRPSTRKSVRRGTIRSNKTRSRRPTQT